MTFIIGRTEREIKGLGGDIGYLARNVRFLWVVHWGVLDPVFLVDKKCHTFHASGC